MSLPFEPLIAALGTDSSARANRPPDSALGLTLASLIELGIITNGRSLQTAVGASEVGYPCARRLAYRLAGVPAVNHGDPMRLLVGTGVHAALEALFDRLDHGAGRFLTEVATVYRDVPGRADLYDVYLRTLLDWKTCSKDRLAKYRADGPPINYRVQLQIYAAGLLDAGVEVQRVGVAFLPYDGALSSLWVWETTPDRREADAAIDRLESLRDADPAEVAPTPDRLCAYCAHYNPRTTDLGRSCPGNSKGVRS